jgi:hypothetical protein
MQPVASLVSRQPQTEWRSEGQRSPTGWSPSKSARCWAGRRKPISGVKRASLACQFELRLGDEGAKLGDCGTRY